MRAPAPAAVNVANATLGAAALQNAYEDQKRRNQIIAAGLGALALIFALIMGLRAAGLLGANASRPQSKMLNATGSRPGDILAAMSDAGPKMLVSTAQKPTELRMPQDVYDWLKHLEKCEGMKNQIIGDQFTEMQVYEQKLQALGPGIGLMDPYEQSKDNDSDTAPGSYTAGKVKDLRPKWQELINFYHSKKPPEECMQIADSFDNGLNEIAGEMGDVADILNSADSDPQGMLQSAKKLQNKSYDIDRFLIQCDKGVGGICSKYNVNKWFNINPDPMAGGLTGKMGITAPATALSPGG